MTTRVKKLIFDNGKELTVHAHIVDQLQKTLTCKAVYKLGAQQQ